MFFGDLVVDLDVKASGRRYDAELADPRRRPLQAKRGHALANKPRGKAVRGGRDPRTKKRSGRPPANYDTIRHSVFLSCTSSLTPDPREASVTAPAPPLWGSVQAAVCSDLEHKGNAPKTYAIHASQRTSYQVPGMKRFAELYVSTWRSSRHKTRLQSYACRG